MKGKWIVVAVVLRMTASAWATDYYVSPSGSDANSGTSTVTPWQTISKVNATTFVAGDRLFFEGGTTNNGNITFDSSDAGTTNNPIVITSYGSGRATISAANGRGLYAENTGGYVISNLNFVGTSRTNGVASQQGIYFFLFPNFHEYFHIDNVEVSGFSQYGVLIGAYNSGAGARDVRITNSDLHDNGAAGLLIDADNPFPVTTVYEITNVYVGNVRGFNNSGNFAKPKRGIEVGHVNGGTLERCVAFSNGANGTNCAGIHVYDCKNITVQYNESFDNKTALTSGSGFLVDDNMSGSRVQYNYSHNNDGPGYSLLHKDGSKPDAYTNNVLRYNISENDVRRNGEIGYGAIDVQGRLNLAEIFNNTVFLTAPTSGTPAVIRVHNEVDTSLDVRSVHFRNNILQSTNSVRLVDVSATELDSASDFLFQGNAYYSSGGTFDINWGGTTYSSLSAWRTAVSQEKIGVTAVGLQTDPLLTAPGSGGAISNAYNLTSLAAYKLRSGSSMIDTGLNLLAQFSLNPGALDFYSNSIPLGVNYDIGANEGIPPPSFTFCPANTNVDCATSTNVSNLGTASASGFCTGSVTVTYSDTITPGACSGNFTITRRFTATDLCGNVNSNCAQTITVADTTSPSFTFCPANTNIDNTVSTNVASLGTATATDDCSGPATVTYADTITPSACVGNFTITRRFIATDGCGNINSNCVQTIVVSDSTQPTISVTAADPQAAEFGVDTGQLTISRIGSTISNLTISYTLAGTASNGTDYVAIPPATIDIAAGSCSTNITITPIPNNVADGDRTVVLELSASEFYSLSTNTTATVTIKDKPYNAWCTANFGVNANNSLVSGETADPDFDGVVNLLEYGLNMNPNETTMTGLPSPSVTNGFLQLKFMRLRPPPLDLLYAGETSADLTNWCTASCVTTQVVDNGNGTETVTITDTVAISLATNRFMRLKITRLP